MLRLKVSHVTPQEYVALTEKFNKRLVFFKDNEGNHVQMPASGISGVAAIQRHFKLTEDGDILVDFAATFFAGDHALKRAATRSGALSGSHLTVEDVLRDFIALLAKPDVLDCFSYMPTGANAWVIDETANMAYAIERGKDDVFIRTVMSVKNARNGRKPFFVRESDRFLCYRGRGNVSEEKPSYAQTH